MRNINYYEKEYIKEDFEQYQVMYRRKNILEILKQYDTSSVLEIGCGMSPLFKYLKYGEDFGSYTIVEPGERFYSNAKNMAGDNKHIKIYKGFIEELAGNISSNFSFIICSGLLHEVANPELLLKSIAILCNKDTVIHINVPNAESFHRILAKEIGLIENVYCLSDRNKLLQQNNIYNMELLNDIVKQAGFLVISQGSYFIKPFTHKQMFSMIKQEIINEDILDGLYEMSKYMPGYGSEIYVNCKLL